LSSLNGARSGVSPAAASCFCVTAECSGVQPDSFRASIWAPRARSSSATSAKPNLAASQVVVVFVKPLFERGRIGGLTRAAGL